MSKLRLLTDRMVAQTARRSELRFRVAEILQRMGTAPLPMDEALATAAVNEIAEVSEAIGQVQVAIADEQGRIGAERLGGTRRRGDPSSPDFAEARAERRDPADPGVPVDLAMHSGPCVECGESRDLDGNGRCALCEIMVASPTA